MFNHKVEEHRNVCLDEIQELGAVVPDLTGKSRTSGFLSVNYKKTEVGTTCLPCKLIALFYIIN